MDWLKIILPFLVGIFATYATFWIARLPFWAELTAIKTIKEILTNHEKDKIAFERIERRFKGAFSDDKLRQMIIRAGGVSFKKRQTGKELWGLASRNKNDM